jgi:(p)ppGpp synthase/HD superfamily hydrolase
MKRFNKAVSIASDAHQGQFRRDGVTPYFSHIFSALTFAEHGNYTEDEKILVALHDVIEDGRDTAQGLIEKGIDANLVQILEDVLTHKKGESYEDYIIKIREASKNSKDINIVNVKIADILANLTDSPTKNQKIKYSKAILSLMG